MTWYSVFPDAEPVPIPIGRTRCDTSFYLEECLPVIATDEGFLVGLAERGFVTWDWTLYAEQPARSGTFDAVLEHVGRLRYEPQRLGLLIEMGGTSEECTMCGLRNPVHTADLMRLDLDTGQVTPVESRQRWGLDGYLTSPDGRFLARLVDGPVTLVTDQTTGTTESYPGTPGGFLGSGHLTLRLGGQSFGVATLPNAGFQELSDPGAAIALLAHEPSGTLALALGTSEGVQQMVFFRASDTGVTELARFDAALRTAASFREFLPSGAFVADQRDAYWEGPIWHRIFDPTTGQATDIHGTFPPRVARHRDTLFFQRADDPRLEVRERPFDAPPVTIGRAVSTYALLEDACGIVLYGDCWQSGDAPACDGAIGGLYATQLGPERRSSTMSR